MGPFSLLAHVGGMLLLELNRVLRPGGFFVWSATPVYQSLEEDVEIWKGKTSNITCQINKQIDLRAL